MDPLFIPIFYLHSSKFEMMLINDESFLSGCGKTDR